MCIVGTCGKAILRMDLKATNTLMANPIQEKILHIHQYSN